MHFAALVANPHGKRRSPVSVARNTPIDDVFQEVAHAARADCGRNPVDRAVYFQQFVLDRRHFDKPRLARVVDKRRVATPAMRITVFVQRRGQQQAALFKVGNDCFVGSFAEYTCQFAATVDKLAVLAYKLHKRQIVFAAHVCVVLAECGRDVHDTGTVRKRYVGVVGYVVAVAVNLGVVVQRFVVRTFEFATLVVGDNFVCTFLEVF